MLDTHRVIQIGLRGTGYALEDLKWGMDQVRRLFLIDEEITFVIVYSIYKITLFPFKSFLRLVKKNPRLFLARLRALGVYLLEIASTSHLVH